MSYTICGQHNTEFVLMCPDCEKSLRSSLKQAQDALAESEKAHMEVISSLNNDLEATTKEREKLEKGLADYYASLVICKKRAEKAESERDQYRKSIMSQCWPSEGDEPGKDELLKEFNAEMEAQESLEQKLMGERDELAGVVEKMREELEHALESWQSGWGATPNGKPYDMDPRYKKALSLPTNYKSILEARDKRVRAGALKWAWNRVLFEGNIMLRGGLMGVKCLRMIVQILRAEAEKGEKG